jgi:hypothetical protein
MKNISLDPLYVAAIMMGLMCGTIFFLAATIAKIIISLTPLAFWSQSSKNILASCAGGAALGLTYQFRLRALQISPFAMLQPVVFILFIASTGITTGFLTYFFS